MLLVGGLLLAACGFYGVLDFVVRDWSQRELRRQAEALVEHMARDAATPLVLGDLRELKMITMRKARDQDAVGAAILRADGSTLASRVGDRRLWTQAPVADLGSRAPAPTVARERLFSVDVFTILAPVTRISATSPLSRDMFDLPGTGAGSASSPVPELLGWVRLTYSTSRIESELWRARQLGLLILSLVVALGLAASLALLRIVVRPLREASDLAREIAGGHLDRRLPVRAGDELGALAESMNTMATALGESREHERLEAAAMRETAEAVVAVAQAARRVRDPADIFRVVAAQLRRVTRCDGVALAVLDPQAQRLSFAHFEPAPPWGGLFRGAELDAPVVDALSGVDPAPLRLQTAAHDLPVAATLAARGFSSALFVPMPLGSGPPAVLLLVSRDDSAFRPAEVRVAAGLTSHLAASLHAAQLQESLENAFAELHRTQEQLMRSERLRVAGELAAGIAHEFNNVLAAILGRVQLLRLGSEAGTLASQELVGALGIMELAARDGAETVRRLRQFGSGESADAPEPVDLDAVIREAVEFTRLRWQNAGEAGDAHVRVDVDSRPGAWVRGTPAHLREVFTNLILNAVDAMPRGGRIRLGCSTGEGSVAAFVEDDGVGMSPETRQHALEPFYTTKGTQGTGLGLSMVYGIVKQHEGTIDVQSRLGHGTRIELSFPGTTAPPVATAVPGAPAPAPGLSIMVVDDEPAVRELLVDILGSLGHPAEGRDGGAAGLAGFVPGRFDLVLTDLGMPGVDGWQVCQSMRAQDDHVTIAFVTGWGEGVDPERARRAGAQAVVPKPFSIEDIEKVVLLAADRRRERAA